MFFMPSWYILWSWSEKVYPLPHWADIASRIVCELTVFLPCWNLPDRSGGGKLFILLPVHGRRRQLLRTGIVVSRRLTVSGGVFLRGRLQ